MLKKRIDNIGLPKDQVLGRLPTPPPDGRGRQTKVHSVSACPQPHLLLLCTFLSHKVLL